MSLLAENTALSGSAGTSGLPLDSATDKERQGHTDVAALLGAGLTILLTLTFTPGAWGFISTIVGSLLLCLLAAFFWRHPLTASPKPESFLVVIALATLIGTAGAITAAWPYQDHYVTDTLDCRAVGVAQATSTVHDLSDTGITGDGIFATRAQLRSIIQQQMDTAWPISDGTALGDAFAHAYTDASGDCLANYTTERLWVIGVPLFGLTLIWWLVRFFRAALRRKALSAEA
jgi:hypothetical protein